MSDADDIPDLCPVIEPDDGTMALDEDTVEFFGVDQMEDNHRLQVRQMDFGLEIVTVHGPKCNEGPGDPIDVFHLTHEQCEVLANYSVRQRQITLAIREIARVMRGGESDPEKIASVALGALLNMRPDDIVSVIAQVTDAKARELHKDTA